MGLGRLGGTVEFPDTRGVDGQRHRLALCAHGSSRNVVVDCHHNVPTDIKSKWDAGEERQWLGWTLDEHARQTLFSSLLLPCLALCSSESEKRSLYLAL